MKSHGLLIMKKRRKNGFDDDERMIERDIIIGNPLFNWQFIIGLEARPLPHICSTSGMVVVKHELFIEMTKNMMNHLNSNKTRKLFQTSPQNQRLWNSQTGTRTMQTSNGRSQTTMVVHQSRDTLLNIR